MTSLIPGATPACQLTLDCPQVTERQRKIHPRSSYCHISAGVYDRGAPISQLCSSTLKSHGDKVEQSGQNCTNGTNSRILGTSELTGSNYSFCNFFDCSNSVIFPFESNYVKKIIKKNSLLSQEHCKVILTGPDFKSRSRNVL